MGAASFIGKFIVKVGTGGIKFARRQPLGIPKPHIWQYTTRQQYQATKALADARVDHLRANPAPYDMEAAIRDLPHSHGISRWWLEKAIKSTHKSASIRSIMAYVKGDGASNLSPHDKADIWMMCMEKMRYLGVLSGFFN